MGWTQARSGRLQKRFGDIKEMYQSRSWRRTWGGLYIKWGDGKWYKRNPWVVTGRASPGENLEVDFVMDKGG